MNRPQRSRMITNMYRSPHPFNHQWRPNHVTPFPWGGNSFRTENSEEQWCETCDRGFPTADLLHKHKQQHQKCNIDGCQFVAHPKVITKHIQMQHSSGLYKKIANLNNPEEIQKWRDERKKRYPTKCNIEKKAAECQEKMDRGEKMEMEGGKKHHFRSDKCTSPGSSIKRKHSFDKRGRQNQKTERHHFKSNSSCSINNYKPPAKKIPRTVPCPPITAEKNKLKPFTGILHIDMSDKTDDTYDTIDCSVGLFEGDDYEESLEPPKDIPNNQEPIVCGALTSLICDYGTSDDETEVKQNDVPINIKETSRPKQEEPLSRENMQMKSSLVNNPEKTHSEILINGANESDDDGPEEVKIVKPNVEHDTTAAPVNINKGKPLPIKKVNPPRNLQNQNHKVRHRIPSTLLQKLLHKEIIQERNIVLQCIRYIKQHNYFDKPKQ